jgi:hypothetical protein
MSSTIMFPLYFWTSHYVFGILDSDSQMIFNDLLEAQFVFLYSFIFPLCRLDGFSWIVIKFSGSFFCQITPIFELLCWIFKFYLLFNFTISTWLVLISLSLLVSSIWWGIILILSIYPLCMVFFGSWMY